jgi:hypothetical protein
VNDEYDLRNIVTNLAVRVGQLDGTLKTFMETWARQDQLAHESRRVTYDRLELVGQQVTRVATDVLNVQQDVAELKKEVDDKIMPTIESVEDRRQQRIGAKSVWALVGAAVMTVASALAYLADRIVSLFKP